MATGDAYYRGGPKDGQIQLVDDQDGYLVFQEGSPPWPWYKLTNETIERKGRVYRVAQYVGLGHDENA